MDYNINRGYYEKLCENKDRPEMDCHGKCQMKKDAEQQSSPENLVKLDFQINLLQEKIIEVLELPFPSKVINSQPNFFYLTPKSLAGFQKIQPQPPKNLV